jgi:DNA-binding IclR family transcriptional regulator
MSYNQDIILEAIRSHPGATAKDLAHMLDLNEISIHRPLRSLGRARMVRFEAAALHGTRKYWAVI